MLAVTIKTGYSKTFEGIRALLKGPEGAGLWCWYFT